MSLKIVSGMILAVLLLSTSISVYNVKTQDYNSIRLDVNSLGEEDKIVFHTNRDSDFEIYSMDADGSNQQRLTSSPSDDMYAVWSPGGAKIAFASERDGNQEIYSMDADGSNQQRLTQNVASDWVPDWSPDKKIVFASNRDGNSEIYVMEADGDGQTRLTVNPTDDRDPVFSPDGSKIAFESSRDGNPEIYVMNADGTGVTRLTYSSAVDRHPDWCLNKIVFTSSRDGNDEIYLMNSDGTGQARLTFHGASDLDPAFSPDGSKIAFSSNRDGNREIYVMNADGTSLIRLTASAGDDYRPDWPAFQRMTKPVEGYIVGTRYRFDFDYLRADPTVSGDVGYRGHRGMDVNKLGILNPTSLLTEEEENAIVGAPVFSPADGKIVYVVNEFWSQTSTTKGKPGKWLWIWHGDVVDLNGNMEMSISTRFLHLNEIPSWIVNSWHWGEEVDIEKGDLIGYVGDTGAEMVGPHLHFETWQGGSSSFISNGQMGAIGSGKVLYDSKERPYWSLTDAGKQLTALNPLRFVDYTEKERLNISAISDCVDLEVVDPDGLTISKDVNELSTRSWYSECGFIEDGNVSCDAITIEYQKRGDYLVTIIPEPGSLPEETYSLEVSTNGTMIVLAEDVRIDGIPAEPYSFFSMGAPTVYIRADSSIEPPDAPISTADNVTYTLTSNIASGADGLVVERDNIVVDGGGFTLQGIGSPNSIGIDLTVRTNVTINNAHIDYFDYGVWLNSSSDNTLSGNSVKNNTWGICFESSSNRNSVSGNNITANGVYGIYLYESSGNSISGNNITNNNYGIWLDESSSNTISGNNITNNNYGMVSGYSSNNTVTQNNLSNNNPGYGINISGGSNNTFCQNNVINNGWDGVWLSYSSYNTINQNNVTNNGEIGIRLNAASSNSVSQNRIANNEWGLWLHQSSSYNSFSLNNVVLNTHGISVYYSLSNIIHHNNFVDNVNQAYCEGSANVWDDGYPSGGNYWSDYMGGDLCWGSYQNKTGSDGIGDTPYVIDDNNRDNYPLMSPYEYWSNPILGDINKDMNVNSEDISQIAVAYGSALSEPDWNPNCDINEDTKVDVSDLFHMGKNYGRSSVKVGLVLSVGGLGDKSLNDISYAGLLRASRDRGIDFDFVEPQTIAEYEDCQRNLAAAGDYALIICVGYDQAGALATVADEYPSQKFAILDGVVDKSNVASLLFKANEGSFLAGVVAGMKTETGKVGFVGGMDIPLVRDYFMGYEAGAMWANSTVEVTNPVFVGGWADPAMGKELALGLIDQGVDVIYSYAGKSGLGALQAVHERGILGLGVDACQCYLYPEVEASMTKRADTAVFDIIEEVVEEMFQGGVYRQGSKEGWVGCCRLPEEEDFWEEEFGHAHAQLEPSVIEKIIEARDKIVAGEIIVPSAFP